MKKVAKALLEKLKQEKLVLDWQKQQTTRAMVFVTIQDMLDELPRAYTRNSTSRSAMWFTSISMMRTWGRARAFMR